MHIDNTTPNEGPMQWTLTADAGNPAAPPTATTNRTTATLFQAETADSRPRQMPWVFRCRRFHPLAHPPSVWNTAVIMNTAAGNMLPAQQWSARYISLDRAGY